MNLKPALILPSLAALMLAFGTPVWGGAAGTVYSLRSNERLVRFGSPAAGKLAGKVWRDLVRLSEEYASYLGRGGFSVLGAFRPSNPAIRILGGRVAVDAVSSGDPLALLSELESMGLSHATRFGNVISGLLPIDALGGLDHLAGLAFVMPAYAVALSGRVTSQGDEAMGSDAARASFGVDGSGVTVGVLSDSFDCLGGASGDAANDDLPADVEVLDDFCPGGTDEGRGMMQLIHDVAPGARLLFHTGFNGQADFADGILELADAGADIIVDDIIYFAEPMFQDGIIAQAVDEVAERGIAYFSSAGNFGHNAYESAFVPSGIDIEIDHEAAGEAHDFDPGAGVDIYQRLTIPQGTSMWILFQWDSPFRSVSGAPGSPNDLDIFLTDDGDPPSVIQAFSMENNVGRDPVEVLFFYNPSGSGVTRFNLLIVNAQGADPGRMKYVVIPVEVGIDEHDTASGAIFGHANASGAEAVGAAFYGSTPAFGTDPPVLEYYSSAGNTPILFDGEGNRLSEPQTRMKPEIVAPDGTNTTFFGSQDVEGDSFPNFFGTSAAAPHAAAAAALILEAKPYWIPTDIYSALETTARDMDDPSTPGFDSGFDTATGYGLVRVDLAIAQEGPPPPRDRIESLRQDVLELSDSGLISEKGGARLLRKLDKALKKLDKGKTDGAVHQLQRFVKKVQKMLKHENIPAEDGAFLVQEAQSIIEALS